MKIHDLYKQVTDSIIRDLEAGAPTWLKPWKNGNVIGLMPQNAATGRPYSGINICLLWGARDENGWPTSEYMTFKQALSKGACVRKGETGTQIVFMKKLTIKDRETEEEKKVGMLRAYTVFNIQQIDGLPVVAAKPPPVFDPIETAQAFVDATKADIKIGGNAACYYPVLDQVALPEPHQFKTPASFYATGLHELGHWTAAKPRLDRDLSGRFGTQRYAAEELIAEMTSAFLCAHLGIAGELRHAGYIETWLKLLKSDDRAIFTAAAKAQQAADYLRHFSETVEENEQEAA